jgi:beta-1,4-mannosyl-glycoprotein beta-1,4-N-acetylglucosaminyltransferase
MSLQEIGLKYGTDKAVYHNFLNFYESKFGHLKDKEINLLEIGFLNGNSIKTWLDFFGNAQIYCIDIIDVDFEHERFHFHKISQDDETLKNIFKDDFFDIIIDDGSHLTSHQLKSLEFLWDKLKYSGFYIIEDLHTSFRLEYVDSEITPYQILTEEKIIDNLIKIKTEMNNIEIFQKNENDLTDSVTSIFNKEKVNEPKIIDCFIFYNELDMLEFRLEELNDVVDRFVIVESTKTFVGKEKPLFFNENLQRFEKYLPKITHIIEQNLTDKNPWVNETTQRNAIDKGIKSLNLNDNDIIMITDVDEIPDTETLEKLKEKGSLQKLMTLRQEMYYYNLNCKFNGVWHFPKILNYNTYKFLESPQQIRMSPGEIIFNGGWHFSYFGDSKFIKNKIQNFSHQEYNNDEFVNDEHIENVIKEGKDLFKRENQNITYTMVYPEENSYLPKNYKKLLKFNTYN